MSGSIARKLALEKLDREEFTLADGTHRAYDVGEAFFRARRAARDLKGRIRSGES